jgi:hypothetical protein
MRKSTISTVIAMLLFTAASAFGHHPFAAEFDHNKPVTLSGAVTRVEWTNPHVYTYLDVKDDQGKVVNWKVEMGSPDALTKAGWTKTTLSAGQSVTLQGWRAKDGTNYANAESMTMPDGKQLSAVTSYLGVGESGQRTDAASNADLAPKAVGTGGDQTPATTGANDRLPGTASPLPFVGLIGLLFLAAGFALRFVRA